MLKDVPGFNGIYKANELGQIYSMYSNRYLKPTSNNGWYLNIRLCLNGISKPYKVHRIIALTFLKNENNLKDVNHKNGLKYDNRVENLEWSSRSDNQKHAFRVLHRKKVMGLDHPKSKIVLNNITGVFYSCLREAAISINVDRNVLKCALRRNKNYRFLSYA